MTNQVMERPPRRGNWYQRLFASMMDKSTAEYDAMVGDHKRVLLGSLHGNVLEIGPGTGHNLAFYPSDVHWLGIEPNPAMHPYLRREAARLGMTIDLREGQSERLDAPDNSMDAVVSTLVLCSVRNPEKTLREILRVLKPGGKFVFLEHVAAPRGTGLRRLQTLIQPAWKIFADGCHVDRETWTTIENAGFSKVELEHFRIDTSIISPQIGGVAIK